MKYIIPVLILVLFGNTAFAQEMGLPIHGQLEDQAQIKLDYTVRLYDVDEKEILSDSGELTTDEAGRYTIHVARGASYELYLSAKTLELEFNSEVLEPRIELGYVPVAKLAENAFLFGGLTPDAYFKKGDKIDFGDIQGAPLNPEATAPLVLEGNAIGLGLCADGQLLMVDNRQWACKALPIYRAGAGLQLSNNAFSVANAGITSAMIAPDAVTNTHIARDAVSGTQIQSGAIVDRHVTSIGPDKVSGTSAVLNTNLDQSFGSVLSIRPNARQVRVGTGGTPTTLEVNGDVEVTGTAQYKSAKIKSVFISAQSFNVFTTNTGTGGVLVERGGLSIARAGISGNYTLFKQLNVQPGDEIRTVRCYQKGFSSTSSQYTAQLISSPYGDNTHSTLANRTVIISPGVATSTTVNSSAKVVVADRSYALWLRMDTTRGIFLGCKVDVSTRRF